MFLKLPSSLLASSLLASSLLASSLLSSSYLPSSLAHTHFHISHSRTFLTHVFLAPLLLAPHPQCSWFPLLIPHIPCSTIFLAHAQCQLQLPQRRCQSQTHRGSGQSCHAGALTRSTRCMQRYPFFDVASLTSSMALAGTRVCGIGVSYDLVPQGVHKRLGWRGEARRPP